MKTSVPILELLLLEIPENTRESKTDIPITIGKLENSTGETPERIIVLEKKLEWEMSAGQLWPTLEKRQC
jgi:hypothetical protein